jgi:hypothetical protein
MKPIDVAWRLLKNYTKPSPVMLPELGETDVERNPPISRHLIDDDNDEQLFHYRMGRNLVDELDSDEKHDFDNQRLRLLLANMFTSQPPYARQASPPTLDTGMGELTREDIERYYSDDRQ